MQIFQILSGKALIAPTEITFFSRCTTCKSDFDTQVIDREESYNDMTANDMTANDMTANDMTSINEIINSIATPKSQPTHNTLRKVLFSESSIFLTDNLSIAEEVVLTTAEEQLEHTDAHLPNSLNTETINATKLPNKFLICKSPLRYENCLNNLSRPLKCIRLIA